MLVFFSVEPKKIPPHQNGFVEGLKRLLFRSMLRPPMGPPIGGPGGVLPFLR